MTRLEYRDEKSSKFWEISVEGASHTVRYGRIGTDGQTKTKDFADAEEAQAAADKLLKAKLKKGYAPVEEAQGGPADALMTLLSGLCDTDEDRAILQDLCASVKEASGDEFTFEDFEFTFEPGQKVVYADGTPKSFGEIAGYVSQLWWDGGGPEVGFGVTPKGVSIADDSGFDYVEEVDEEAYNRVKAAGPPRAAFGFGQNWTFFDPTRTLENGEPALAFVSHEECEWTEVRSADMLNYKQIFLRLISDAMLETEYIDEVYA